VILLIGTFAISSVKGKETLYITEKPEPKDGIYLPGKSINVKFNEQLDCDSSYSAKLIFLKSNKQYYYLNNLDKGDDLKNNSLSSECFGSTISFLLSPEIDYYSFIGEKVKMVLCNVVDQSNNTLRNCVNWNFYIGNVSNKFVTTKIYMNLSSTNESDAEKEIANEISRLSNCSKDVITVEPIQKQNNVSDENELTEVILRFNNNGKFNSTKCLHNLNKYYFIDNYNNLRERRGFFILEALKKAFDVSFLLVNEGIQIKTILSGEGQNKGKEVVQRLLNTVISIVHILLTNDKSREKNIVEILDRLKKTLNLKPNTYSSLPQINQINYRTYENVPGLSTDYNKFRTYDKFPEVHTGFIRN